MRDVSAQYAHITAAVDVCRTLDSLPVVSLLVNSDKHIVFANRAFRAMTRCDPGEILGHRIGDGLDCAHHDEPPGGCGTTDFCMQCGAQRALRAATNGAQVVEECRICTKTLGHDLDLRVYAKPFVVKGQWFTLMTLIDIASEKRRAALERIFFHDVLNTASAVHGISKMLLEDAMPDGNAQIETLEHLSSQLMEEIESQRDLSAMEQGDLAVEREWVSTRWLLEDVVETYRKHEMAAKRFLAIDPASANLQVQTDRRLLRRVLGNMTKNALEAARPGTTVTLGCDADAARVSFRVHNQGVISKAVQLQLFQRSFSTKGRGRGLGTYSIKLLTEGYLGGEASCTSTEDEGTTFTVSLPLAAS